MGRSSSRSSSSSFGRSKSSNLLSSQNSSSSRSKSNLYSKPTNTTQPVQIQHTVQQPGFFSNMWQGFGLGAGQSIAMNLFRSPTEVKHTYEPKPVNSSIYDVCIQDGHNKNSCTLYDQCMKKYNNDKSICMQHLEND